MNRNLQTRITISAQVYEDSPVVQSMDSFKGLNSTFLTFISFVKNIYLSGAPGLWDADSSSLTRNWSRDPCLGAQSLSHWTTREVPQLSFLYVPKIYVLKVCFQSLFHTPPFFLTISIFPFNVRKSVFSQIPRHTVVRWLQLHKTWKIRSLCECWERKWPWWLENKSATC